MATANRFLAYFDILGFKHIVDNLSDEALDKFYSNIMRDTQWAYADDGKLVNRIEAHPVYIDSPIKGVNVSDSIILFSEDDSEASLKAMLNAISKFVAKAETGYGYRGYLVVGSLNYVLGTIKRDDGEVAYNVSAIYGKALIEGYQKAESQEWIGVSIDTKVVEHADTNGMDMAMFANYIKYTVPFKNKQEELLALKTTLSDSNGISHENQVKNLFQRNSLTFNPALQTKYDNTLAFRKYCNTL